MSLEPPKLCPKIILEVTRLTHKTDIAFRLNEHPHIVGPRKYRYHFPIVSAEWCGFTNTPWGRGLINFRPQEAERAMETYRVWARLFELLKYYSWIVDRFHLSTMVHQKGQGRRYDFRWLEGTPSASWVRHHLLHPLRGVVRPGKGIAPEVLRKTGAIR